MACSHASECSEGPQQAQARGRVFENPGVSKTRPRAWKFSRRPDGLAAKLALESGILLGGVQERADFVQGTLGIACRFEIGARQSTGIRRRQAALCAWILSLEASHLDHVGAVGTAELAGVADRHVDR